MTRDEFIEKLKSNLKPDAKMDFLYLGKEDCYFLDIKSINMNADIDDPENSNRGGIVFVRKE